MKMRLHTVTDRPSHPLDTTRRGLCAVLQNSSTPARNASRSDAGGPSLRVAGFEDEGDDEDENEVPA
jgi:hypothetical protein